MSCEHLWEKLKEVKREIENKLKSYKKKRMIFPHWDVAAVPLGLI